MRTFSLVVTCASRIFFFSLNKSLHRGGVPLFAFLFFSNSFLFSHFFLKLSFAYSFFVLFGIFR